MKIERVFAESAAIAVPVNAERLAKEEKQTLTSEAVAFDAEQDQQQSQQDTRNKSDDQPEHPPTKEHDNKKGAPGLGKHLDVRV